MKTMKRMLALAATLVAAVACGPKKEAPKVLVLYYSQTGNTKVVAEEFATRLGADIEAIEAVNPYDGDFAATIERCQKEREKGLIPEIKLVKADIAAYDYIFLGYPVWFGTYAPPVAFWLNEVNLKDKKVVPFCTFGSGGLDSAIRDLKAAQPEAEILEGYGVRAARVAAIEKEVDRFLKAGGFIEGEYFQPEEFPGQHPVSEEEAAIFDAAVNGYPMLNAKAATVASRPAENGTEYLFTATPLPREDRPDFPPMGDVKVYVLAEEGQAPVFTQVLR
jgi:flavodoxin